MKGLFFFESVGVPEGSPELGKGNSGWVPSYSIRQDNKPNYNPQYVAKVKSYVF